MSRENIISNFSLRIIASFILKLDSGIINIVILHRTMGHICHYTNAKGIKTIEKHLKQPYRKTVLDRYFYCLIVFIISLSVPCGSYESSVNLTS
jgi:hypothetical protein